MAPFLLGLFSQKTVLFDLKYYYQNREPNPLLLKYIVQKHMPMDKNSH